MLGLTRKNKISPLIENALGGVMNESDLTLINGSGTQITLPAGSTFMVEGTVGAEALLILEGTAAVSRENTPVANVGVGDLVGEQSLITGELRNATVIATTEVTALVLSRQEFSWLRLFSTNFGEMAEELVETRS